MTTDQTTMVRHLHKKSKELLSREHLPGELVALVVAVADRQLQALPGAACLAPEPDAVTEIRLHNQGVPLLPRERFRPDPEQARALLLDILDIAEKIEGSLGSAARDFRENHLPNLDMDQAIAAHLGSDEAYFTRWAEKTPEAPRLVNFLVQAALSPSLIAQGKTLNPELDPARPWPHGHCPVCGSLPFISSLRGREGTRFCTCSFCLTEYRVPRLACPFCGENDHKKLTFYDSPDEPGYRIDACKSCRRYIKTTDFRNLDKTSVPSLDDLESLHMDILAQERSYLRPTLSVWGF